MGHRADSRPRRCAEIWGLLGYSDTESSTFLGLEYHGTLSTLVMIGKVMMQAPQCCVRACCATVPATIELATVAGAKVFRRGVALILDRNVAFPQVIPFKRP